MAVWSHSKKKFPTIRERPSISGVSTPEYPENKGNLMKKSLVALLIGMGAIGGVAACDDNDGPAEEMGEEIDEAGDEMEEAGDELEDEVE
jgi:hypothetical protein